MAKYKIFATIDENNSFWVVIDNGIFLRNPTEEDLRRAKVRYYNKTNICPWCRKDDNITDKSILYPKNARQFSIDGENIWFCEIHGCRYRYNPDSINDDTQKPTHTKLNIVSDEEIRYYYRENIPVEQRFWKKVIKKGNDECWLWTGSINSSEYKYGRIGVNGKNELAHRVSWILTYGNIPEEMNVLHKCDNPQCVNPNHLFLGTHQDNMDDMINKGRDNHDPEDNGCAKLTWDMVRDIRKIYDIDPEIKRYGKWHNLILANDYGISEGQVGRILNNKSWQSSNK